MARPAMDLLLRSLSVRLALLFSATTVLLLAAMTGTMYWVLARTFDRQAELILSEEVEEIRAIAEREAGRIDALRERMGWEAGPQQQALSYSRVVLGGGAVRVETLGMSEAVGGARFPEPVAPGARWRGGVLWSSGEERYFLLGAALGNAADARTPPPLIHVALDITRERDVLEDYRRGLALALLAGALVSALAGFWVARRGLRPVAGMTHAVCAVTPEGLDRRLGTEPWPTELRPLAQAFDEMLVRLEEAFGRLTTFSADLAHDLRTPLGNCLGEVEVALSKPREPEEYRRVLESSLEELRRISRMVDTLLFLARADSAAASASRRWCDAREELGAVADFYGAVAEEQGVTLRCEGEGQVWADPTLLRRAVTNLVANALTHTPRGGQVTLGAEPEPGGALTVRVTDTGGGVAPEDLPRLFDRFFRTADSRSRQPQGLGLGLTIVRSILDLHGGKVEIQSQPGRGTEVRLLFPAAPA